MSGQCTFLNLMNPAFIRYLNFKINIRFNFNGKFTPHHTYLLTFDGQSKCVFLFLSYRYKLLNAS